MIQHGNGVGRRLDISRRPGHSQGTQQRQSSGGIYTCENMDPMCTIFVRIPGRLQVDFTWVTLPAISQVADRWNLHRRILIHGSHVLGVTSQLTISYSWGRNVNYNGTIVEQGLNTEDN